jgi:hypothetical protein
LLTSKRATSNEVALLVSAVTNRATLQLVSAMSPSATL